MDDLLGVSPLLVIFDCDGVLVDSEPLTAAVSARVLSSLGWDVSAADVLRQFMGCTDDYWRRQVHEHTGRVVDETWDQEFGPLYEEALEADLREVAGIRQVLERLPWRYCVASNGSHKKIRTNLRRVGLAELFSDAIFSAEDVRVGKPSPELFLYAAQTMGFAPEQCIVVEDSVHGVRAARAAGMEVLAYAVGLIDPVLLEGPRTTIFTRMDDLSQLLIRTAKTLGKPQHSST